MGKLPEQGRNLRIKTENFKILTHVGIPFVKKARVGFDDSIVINSLATSDGNMLFGSLLSMHVSQSRGDLILRTNSHNSRPIAKFTYYVQPNKNFGLELCPVIDTFEYEGSGFGKGLFFLGEKVMETITPTLTDKAVVALVVDRSRSLMSTTPSRKNWTSIFTRGLGYSRQSAIFKKFGYKLSGAGDILLKQLQ